MKLHPHLPPPHSSSEVTPRRATSFLRPCMMRHHQAPPHDPLNGVVKRPRLGEQPVVATPCPETKKCLGTTPSPTKCSSFVDSRQCCRCNCNSLRRRSATSAANWRRSTRPGPGLS